MIQIACVREDEIMGLEMTLGDHVITDKFFEFENEGMKYFTIRLDEEIVIIKVYGKDNGITIDVGGKLFTIVPENYKYLVVG
jgi:hypothetical protein